jgi:hypothetical protein
MGLREHKHGVSSAVWGHPSRTLMRTPVVKRRTLPKSGCCQFFPLCFMLSAVRLWQRVLSSLPSAGALTCLHHTRIEGLPPSAWR